MKQKQHILDLNGGFILPIGELQQADSLRSDHHLPPTGVKSVSNEHYINFISNS